MLVPNPIVHTEIYGNQVCRASRLVRHVGRIGCCSDCVSVTLGIAHCVPCSFRERKRTNPLAIGDLLDDTIDKPDFTVAARTCFTQDTHQIRRY